MSKFTAMIENVSKACKKSVRTFKYGFRQGAIKAYAEAQKKELQKVTPRSEDNTEHAGDAWEIEYDRDGGFITGFEVTNPHDRIDYVEYGTPRHLILPKKKDGVLRFEMDGKIVFARAVDHPGIKEMGFVREVQDTMGQEIPSWARKVFDAPIEKHWNK